MPEGDRAPTERHATWVALRSFRQRPAVVGRTEQGETIYEVRAVRLLFPPGAAHFRRLVQCAKCRMDMAGSPVLSPDDLDRQPNPVFCRSCGRPAPRVVEAPALPPPDAPRAEQPVEQDGALPEAVAEVQRELHEIAGAVRDEVGQAVDGAVRQAVAGMAQPLAELTGRQQALEEKLADTERRLDALTASVDAGMSQQHVMEQMLNECMEQIRRLAEPHAEPSRRAPGEILEGLEKQLRAAEERLSQR